MKVAIRSISIGKRMRPISATHVDALSESIRDVGLLQPIVVTNANVLVVGAHRLEACRALGWTEIEATVVTLEDIDRELAEIDENLIRNDLSVLDRSEHLARRKVLYVARHQETRPVTEQGGPGRGRKGKTSETISFVSDTAAKTHRSPRTIEHEVQIATAIDEKARDVLRDTASANSKTDLLLLARVKDKDKQVALAEKVASGEAPDIKTAQRAMKEDAREQRRDENRAVISGRFCLVPFAPLCFVFDRMWRQWQGQYRRERQRTRDGGGWESECIFVPRNVVFEALQRWSNGTATERAA